MKKAGIAAIAAAGIVALGGGAWAAVTLPVSSEETVTSGAIKPTPMPDVEPTPGVTPTPDVTPTPEAVETPEATPEPTIEPEPAPDPEPEPAEPEPLTEDQIFLEWANQWMTHYGKQMDDATMLATLDHACSIVASGSEERAVPVEIDNEHNDINTLFMGAARNGYFTEGDGPASYCD